MKKTLLAAAVFAIAGFSTAAIAATATSSFQVKLTIQSSCAVTAGAGSDIDFSTQPSTATNLAGTSNISVTCSNTTPYNVGLLPTAAGGTANGTGNLISGTTADQVPYKLWTDLAHSNAWGNTVGSNTLAGIGNGSAQTIPVYATIASANFAPGAYADTVTVTVTY